MPTDAAKATDATVFDALHRLFGAGDFTGGEGEWHRWRMREISKIKAYRSKRNVDPFELVDAARYCRKRGIWIKAHWQLYEHLPAAGRERLSQAKQDETADLEALIQDAIEQEAANPDSPWVDRLIRAAGQAREEVYREWLEWSSAYRSRHGTVGIASSPAADGATSGGRR